MPYKVFVAGEEALAADANQYLMSQTVPRFTNAAQRTSQLTAPVLNQLSITDDRPILQRYSGSAWVDMPGVLSRWTATNPNQVAAAATDFILTTFTMPFAGTVQFQGFAMCTPGAGATALVISMTADAAIASIPAATSWANGYGPGQPANAWAGSFPFAALWSNLAAGTNVTIKVRVGSSAPGSMGTQVSALFGQTLIVPTPF